MEYLPPGPRLTWLPEEMAQIAAVVPKLGTKQICSLSASCIAEDLQYLRPGVRFTVIYPTTIQELLAVPTKKNFSIRIDFVDGIKWLLVVRCFVPSPVFKEKRDQEYYEANPPPHPRGGVMSEVLSLQAMRAGGVGMVPNAYLPKKEGIMTPTYPTAHFYCDFMPGHPVSRLLDLSAMADGDHEDDELLKRFIESYADYQIALSKIRFESIGQLMSSPDNEPIMGPIRALDDPLAGLRDETCSSLGEFHIMRIQGVLQAWRDKEEEWGNEGMMEYITLLECRRWLTTSGWLRKPRTDFCFVHPGINLGNLLVVEGELSAVVGWQGVHSTTKEEAFAAPAILRPKSDAEMSFGEILDSDLSKCEIMLRDAYIAKGRHDLAGCVEGGKMYRALWKVPKSMKELKRYRELIRAKDWEVLPEERSMSDWACGLIRFRYHNEVGLRKESDKVIINNAPGW